MQKKQKWFAVLLCLCVAVCVVLPAFAADDESTGKLGPTVSCMLNETTGEVLIFLTDGAKSGSMADFAQNRSPFPDPAKVKTVRIAPWVRNIGAGVFAGCVNLTEIWIPFTVREIGADAFAGCGNFTVHYNGSEEEWKAVQIGSGNDALKSAPPVFGPFEDISEEPFAEPTVEPKPENLCPWCNTIHGDGFFQRIVAWFHGILAKIIRK